ncbi:MAG TPA: ankyrin repeat domain-containing protein [Candidatus Babeliales bacterium]|jgi:hypothetical protein|nr:ankyrin repeat domain-containing protein [Candidatus Babeliales bacterium]
MRKQLLWVLFWAAIAFLDNAVAMNEGKDKVSLYDLVTAEKLDHAAFDEPGGKWFLINHQDKDGRTPLHHLMRHKDTTAELVNLFIQRGAQLKIEDDWGNTAYHDSFAHIGRSPLEVEKGLYLCNKKVSMHLFTEMLVKRFGELQMQWEYEQKWKKAPFS